ncbi:MAG TPA: diguanylate cyclase [Noviherbaspirillum sp.]
MRTIRNFVSIPAAAAVLLMTAGVTTMAGWLVRNPAVVQLGPDFIGMVFSTAFCFTLAGFALLLPVFHVPGAERMQAAIGKLLIAMATIVLVAYLADAGTPLDLHGLHAWLDDGNPVPGRMAPGAAAGFALAGFVLLMMQRVRSKAAGGAIQTATYILLILGFVGLAGYSLQLELLYDWFPAKRIAIQSAVALLVMGVGLWGQWRRAEWYRTARYFQDDEKTGYVAATILTAIAMSAGIIGFAVQQATLSKTLSENLLAQLRNQTTLFQTIVNESMTDAEILAARPPLIQLARTLGHTPGDAEAERQLHVIAKSILASRYSGVAIHDIDGRELLRVGRFAAHPEIRADLGMRHSATLLWERGVLVHIRVPLRDRPERVGTLVIEQPLPVITDQLARMEGFGTTGELGICTRQDEQLVCFPQRRNPAVHSFSRLNAEGRLTPMGYATDGLTGVFNGMDYRRQRVIAAYGPLTKSGLGIVVKQDAEELFTPIRQQLNWYIPLLLLLVVGGALLLRSQVKPLVAKLIRSERHATSRELHIRTVVDNIAEGIITLNENGTIASFNRAAARIFGYSPEEAIGMPITAMMPPSMRDLHEEGMRRYLRDGSPRFVGMGNRELLAMHKNGTVFPLELAITEMRADEGRLFVGIVRDISERKKAAERMQHLAHYDILTDLPNRALFADRLRQAFAKARRDKCRMALLFVDLDKFKPVNDSYGHDTGDLLLKEVAARLQDCLRESDTVARVGGDEFIVLLPQIDAGQDGLLVAEKILAALSAPFHVAGHALDISASIGVAIYPEDGHDQEALLKSADTAMYRAKESGGAAVIAFSRLSLGERSAALSE